MDFNQILAALINSVLVLVVVQLLKTKVIPWLNSNAPVLLPIIAMVIGPAIAALTSYLTGQLGWPIDLSLIIAVFTGGTAVAFHQVGKQAYKMAA